MQTTVTVAIYAAVTETITAATTVTDSATNTVTAMAVNSDPILSARLHVGNAGFVERELIPLEGMLV